MPALPASQPLSQQPTVSPQQTQAPIALQRIPLHLRLPPLPQRAQLTLPQDQVWTCMARSQTLPQVGLGAYRRPLHLLRRIRQYLG